MKAFMSQQLEEILKDPIASDALRNGLRRSRAVGTPVKPEEMKTIIITKDGSKYEVELVNRKDQ